MIKLSTAVEVSPLPVKLGASSRIVVLGSCFADSIGHRLSDSGFGVCVNPFGTLYNPVSVLSAVRRLCSGKPFVAADCEPMGAGAGKICSFEHHTSFARATEADFLDNANSALAGAAAFWKNADTVVVTLGTSMVWRLVSDGRVASNCLKRPSAEFSHEMLSLPQVEDALREIVSLSTGKRMIFMVSPIRLLGDGAHADELSKARLLLAVESLGLCYFPAYEILLDELRDYRFYAADLVHPSEVAEEIIWSRFVEAAVDETFRKTAADNLKASRAAAHHTILK